MRPVLNRKYLALKVRIINAGRQSVTVKPDEINVNDAFAEHALTFVSGAELGRRMRKLYNWARLAVDPAEASKSSEAPGDGMTPQMLAMMRAMAARAQGPGGGTILPNKNLLYTDEPGALPMAPMRGPTAECGQVCQLLSRETAGPDVLAQLQRQTSPDYVERNALLANTILPQADTTGLLYYPMAKLSHPEGASGSGKNARKVRVTVPVGQNGSSLSFSWESSSRFAPIMSPMRALLAACGIILLLVGNCAAAQAQTPAGDPSSALQITLASPNTVVVGSKFTFPLAVSGGSLPYSWRQTGGQLPPGLKLHAHSGLISGVPTAPGEYHFTVAVTDGSIPALATQREVTITVTAALTIDWKLYPAVNGNAISGSVVVSNQTGHSLDLTVIVVAVNSIGRATALGYQHFIMGGQQAEQVIPFGSSPGPETYVIHADAVGHPKSGHYIFRARKQTAAPIQITEL